MHQWPLSHKQTRMTEINHTRLNLSPDTEILCCLNAEDYLLKLHLLTYNSSVQPSNKSLVNQALINKMFFLLQFVMLASGQSQLNCQEPMSSFPYCLLLYNDSKLASN